MSSYPPVRVIPSIPVPEAVALEYLTTYLNQTPSNPYLLPNAKLESSGPTTGASNSSITISNLQRLQAGLKGEWLPPVFDLGEDVGVAGGLGDESGQVESNGGEWQNLEDYQLEQEELEGEVAPTPTVVKDGEQEVVDGEEEKVVAANAKSLKRKHDGTAGASERLAKKPKDKEARKAEKKERHKAEQREKMQARAAAKAAGNA